MRFQFDDGGRGAADYRGTTGDCVVRAVAISTQQPYQAVYEVLGEGCRTERLTRGRRKASARDGIHVQRQWFKRYMERLGWRWTPTMGIGTGCTTHLREHELPAGRIIVSLSKHYAAVVDGVIHDNHDPSRGGTRCVYGYWSK